MSEPVYTESIQTDDRSERWRWMWDAANRGADMTGATYFEIDFDPKTMIVTINGWIERKDNERQ